MRTKMMLTVLILIIFVISCNSHKNYIELKSIDGEQTFRKDAEYMQLFPNSVIDTTILYKMMGDWSYHNKNFPEIIQNTSDSVSFVIKIDRAKKGTEGEILVSLFGEFNNNNITKLYLLEVDAFPHYWKLTESIYSMKRDIKNKNVKIIATLKAINFQASSMIKFPYNEKGLYDYDIERYMIVECGFNIEEDLLDYFF